VFRDHFIYARHLILTQIKKAMQGKKVNLFLLFVLFVVSCVDQVRDDNSFIIATYDDVKDWDPATAFSLEVFPMSNIYEPLLWHDAGTAPGRFLPGLATTYTSSSDGLTWEFTLRKGVTFHDGRAFDSESVRYVIERNKRMNGGGSYIWDSVDQVITDGPHRVIFKLSSPVPLDKIVSSQYGAWMYSPEISELSKDSLQSGYGSGTGPYQFKKWTKNKHIKLQRYDDYWAGWNREDHFDSIIIKVVSESSTRLQMIEGGLVDYALLIPVQLLERLDNNPSISVSYRPSWINHFYLLNTKKPPTDNIWVRRAIAAIMDRKTIADHVYLEAGKEARGLIPDNMPLFEAPDSLVPFSLDMGKRFLDRSGITTKNISADISYVSTSEEYRLTSFLLMDNLRKIGLDLDLKPGLWSSNWDKARRLETASNIISMAWWPTLSSPSDWFFGLYKTEESPLFNLSYYSNPIVDSLINTAWKNESIYPERSRNLYKEIQEKLINDCVVIPVVDINVQSVHKKNITGLRNNPAYSTLLIYHLGRGQ